MNVTSRSSSTLSSTAQNATVDVSAQAEPSAMHFLLSPEQGDSLSSSELNPSISDGLTAKEVQPFSDGLTAEKAQPLMESLQAQISYREAMGQGQTSNRVAADTSTLSLVDMPRVDLALSASKYRTKSASVTDDSEVTTHDSYQPEPDSGLVVSSLFFFQPPVDQRLTLPSDNAALPLSSAENMPAASWADLTLADITPQDISTAAGSAGGSPSLAPHMQPKATEQAVLTLPMTLNRDQTGYAQPLVTALSGHLTWQITQQQQSVELQLHPAELGAMTITLHMNANALQLHIHAEVPETQQLLQQTANELKESLTLSQGSQVAVDVSSQGHQQRRQTPQQQHSKVVSANHLSLTEPQALATDHSILITL